MIIYKVVNKINGKIYIGKTIKTIAQRKAQHFYESRNNKNDFIFHKAIRKYGENSFSWEIIEHCPNEQNMDNLELYYINSENSYYGNNNGYNMTKDGSSGMRGKKQSKHFMKIMKNYKHSSKTKEKIRQAVIKNPRKNFTMLGKTHSKKTKEKISKSVTGNTNGAKKHYVFLNGKEIIIHNIIKWCKENNYSYTQARWRIKKNIDLSLPDLRGKWCR